MTISGKRFLILINHFSIGFRGDDVKITLLQESIHASGDHVFDQSNLAFLAHLSQRLKVNCCDHLMSVIRHLQFLQRTSPSKLLTVTPIWPCLIIVQMILVSCISRSHRLK